MHSYAFLIPTSLFQIPVLFPPNMSTKRIHESIALSALLSGAFTLQTAWIANLLVYRNEWVRDWFTLSEKIGPISGMYLRSFIAYAVLFGVFMILWRGKDCSHWRQRVFWFFLISVVMFLIMTLPIVYQFSVTVE